MMNHSVVRTKAEEEALFERLRRLKKPYKCYSQEISHKATVDQYAYLFGCVYKIIGEYMGEPDVREVHKRMLAHFSVEYSPLPHNPLLWQLRIKRGSEWDVITISEFIEMIAAWAHTEFGGSIPLPNEVWSNE